MVNLAICARCSRCAKYYPSEVDNTGNLVRLPSVDCGLPGLSLMGDSELPEDCACLLEQTVSEDDAWDAFESLKEEVEAKI